MNQAYRVAWNQALQVWRAVAEISRRKGNTKASVLLGGLLLRAPPAGAVDEAFTGAPGNGSVDGNWAYNSALGSGTDLLLNFDYDTGNESSHDLGALTLTGTNTYTDDTAISNGTLKIGAGGP
ncbi:ESPR-type extended signal peptide-containing protein [Marinobacterium weihaiense]|uniref:ESPR domain-containing protein n=1 Tax=Marinobacterium weihaiense TaxID=2851016 RepID=A0ABS6M8D4_9GAMM|nr:ESPR-type extended signal peptide-containing protein [Marinobacterium weihaiense]MBV0932551.1 hypothetical protein [Marinobacterium weihaiense]